MFTFFSILKSKIQQLFYVNPRVTVTKVFLFYFAGAMVDMSTPLVLIKLRFPRNESIATILVYRCLIIGHGFRILSFISFQIFFTVFF